MNIKYRPPQTGTAWLINFFLLSLCVFTTELLAEGQTAEKQATANVVNDFPWQVIPPLKAEVSTLQEKGFESVKQLLANINKASIINDVAYSPDGKTLLSGSLYNTLKLWDIRSGKPLRTFEVDSDSRNLFVLSPDTKILLSDSGKDMEMELWEVNSGKFLRTFLRGNYGFISAAAFSSDGKMLLSGSFDKTLKLWEVDSGKLLRTLSEGNDDDNASIYTVSFSPNSKILASSVVNSENFTWHNQITLWDADLGKPLHVLSHNNTRFTSITFSPDGKTLLSGSSDKTLKLWEVDSGKLLRTFSGHTDEITSVAFSPDGKTLLSGSFDKTLKLWEVDSGKLLRTFSGHTNGISSVAFSPDGKTLLSGSSDKTLKLWEVDSGKLLRTFSSFKDSKSLVINEWINPIALSPDSKTLLSGYADNTLTLWEVDSGKLLHTFLGHNSEITSITFSPNGKRFLSADWDNTLKLWEVDSGKLLNTFKGISASFSPNGKMLLNRFSNTLKLWEVDSGKLLHTFSLGKNGSSTSTVIAFSPNNKMLLSKYEWKDLKLWEISSGKLLRTFSGHIYGISSVAFSPDGKTLLSGSFDKTLKLWEVDSGKLLRTFSGHNKGIYSVAFSSDGRTLLSGSSDKTLKLWEVDSGKLLRTFSGHNKEVYSVAFNPDGKTLFSSSWDNTIKLWDINSGKLLDTFSDLPYLVLKEEKIPSVAFNFDSQTLLSSSEDQTIKQWNVQTGKLKKTLWSGRNGTWISVNHHANNEALSTLSIANNGSIFLPQVQQNTLPHGEQLSNKDNLKLEFETLEIIAVPNKTQFHPITIRNTGKLPAYWLSLEQSHLVLNPSAEADKHSALLYIAPAEIPLTQPNQPWQAKTIQVLEAGQSATLYANIFASIPYKSTFIQPNKAGYKLPITIVTANGTKVTKQLTVKIKLPKLAFINSENTYNAETEQLQLTLLNTGEDSLKDASFSLKWPEATASQIKASEVIRPEIEPYDKVPLSFALPSNLSKQQIEAITLTVATKDYPWYLWQGKAEIGILTRYALLIGLAISLVLLGLSLFFYRRYRIFKHPLILSLSQQPHELLTLVPEQLAEAQQRLHRAKLLTLVLNEIGISINTLNKVIAIFNSTSVQQKAQYLAHQLGAQLTNTQANHKTSTSQSVYCYELQLNHDFILNLDRIRLYFPKANTDPMDVFKEIKALADSNRYVILIIGKDSQYQRDLYITTKKTSNKWIAPQDGELSHLFLSPDADKVLVSILARQLSLQYISPYQIGGGVKKQGVFFGRKEMIHQIVTNDPANYLVVGGRQMGKSSLLKALERHYKDLDSIDCCYISLSNEVLIPRLVEELGIKQTDNPEIFAHQLEQYLQNFEQHMVFLVDEADKFVANEISTEYPILNVMRRLSEEGHCTFILAGFWQLYQHAVLDYQSPIRNFAETIYVGALEKAACYQLATEPMQNIHLSYANEKIIQTVIEACGQRANLIVQVCKFIVVNMSAGQRLIKAEDVQNALYSDEINKELASWVLSDSKIGQYYDKLIVYATISLRNFSSGELIQLLQEKGVKVDINALDRSLARLGLVYILGKDQRSGRYAYHVPLFVEMIQRDDPEIRLQTVLLAGY